MVGTYSHNVKRKVLKPDPKIDSLIVLREFAELRHEELNTRVDGLFRLQQPWESISVPNFAFLDTMILWVSGREQVHLWLLLPGYALDGVESSLIMLGHNKYSRPDTNLSVVLLAAVKDWYPLRISHRNMVRCDANKVAMLLVQSDCIEVC